MEQSTDDTQRGSVDSCPESNQSWTNDVAALLSIGTICLAEVPLAAWALASMIANPSRQYTTLPCFFCDDGQGGEIHHRAPHWVLFLGVLMFEVLPNAARVCKRTTQGNHARGLHNINFPLICNRCVSIFLDLRQYLSNPWRHIGDGIF